MTVPTDDLENREEGQAPVPADVGRKLSKAQYDLLSHAVSFGRAYCGVSYQPVRKLVALGLATSHEGRMGSHWIEPTERGRAVIRATNGA